MSLKKYFSDDIIQFIRASIKEADNHEVFFTGDLDENGVVTSIKIGARGNEHTVPVNQTHAKTTSVLIHNHPSGNLTPSDADLNVAGYASEDGKGFYIINNSVTEIYVVVEPVKPVKIKPLDIEEAGQYISNGGALSKMNPMFEERTVQIELLKQIAQAFNENRLGAFEAGTGVGKSYAYLIPSVLWALTNNEKVVVSTGTINLQQQLCEKDIPAVEKILGKKVRFVLMKGRQNYICKRRLNEVSGFLDLFEEETEDLKKIIEWANSSSTGSKSELTFFPNEAVWGKVNSESDACMGMRCPYHSECFVMRLRKEAAGANVIVVNHHLLFADIESRLGGAGYDDAAVLPPYRRIVFDEAHGIESAATSFFSESLTRFKLNKLINQMYRKRKNSEAGHLCNLAILSANEEKVSFAYEMTSKIKAAINNMEITARDLMGNEYSKRLYNQTERDFGPFLVAVSNLSKELGEFTDLIRLVIDGIDDDDKDTPSYWETKIILRRLDSYVLLLKNFNIWSELENEVFWIQKRRLPPDMVKDEDDGQFVVLNQTPLDISTLMNQGVFEPMESVICTSATLKSGHDFRYWMNRTGLSFGEKERICCSEYLSPFPYEKNMLFAVPNDAPLPEKMEFQQYIEMAIPKLISAAEGRTLVLFTSYDSLKSAFRAAQLSLKGFPGRLMRQGEDDNSKLLEAFKQEKESVLFATDSFWQGVDIPGESLSQVIIVKLPFTVPNDPVFVARSEAIEKRGGNSFMELSVPEAIIKFRQGIGRLIRRSDDRGVVVVLDRRIYEKRYGSFFTVCLGECKKLYEPLSQITSKITDFIFR
ncbi:MAG: helicase [Treponema sp.]|nr:helicase [Treponema sp.]